MPENMNVTVHTPVYIESNHHFMLNCMGTDREGFSPGYIVHSSLTSWISNVIVTALTVEQKIC